MFRSPAGAMLVATAAPDRPQRAVLLLHGGQDESQRKVHWTDPAALRMWPLARSISRHLPSSAVYRLADHVRGWNGDGADPIADARWAISLLRDRYAGLPIVVVGHSMGGRVAAQIGGDAGVAGCVLLAPDLQPGDPVAPGLDRHVLEVIQGANDRTCPEPGTRVWLSRAQDAGAVVSRQLVPLLGHMMLRKFWVWHRLTWQAVRTITDG